MVKHEHTDTYRIHRHEVPVDDRWHMVPLDCEIVQVGCRRADVVEFWSPHCIEESGIPRWFRVVGTGHPLPDLSLWRHIGTAVAPGGALVWHLVESVTGGVFPRDPAMEPADGKYADEGP